MKVITTNRLNRFWKNGVKPIKDALANKLNTANVVNNLLTTAAGYALDARQGKVLDDKITALNGKLLRAKNTPQTGWSFFRVGNLVFFEFNKGLNGVVANNKYTNQGSAPTGYRPVSRYFANGVRSAGTATLTGYFYFEISKDGTVSIISSATHSEAQSYSISGCYITEDAFPTADKY